MTPPTIALQESGIRWLWVSVAILALDQLTKLWVVSTLEIGESVNVLPFFDIHRTFNEGAAWSMFADAGGWQRWAFSAIAIVVSVVLVVWLRRLALASHALLAGALTLILGGAIGNVLDRLRLGHVVDFVLVYWNDARFPAFNVADAAISIGAACVVLDAVLEGRRSRQAAKQ